MPTLKQKRAVANMVENGGNASKAMRDAGYSPATAKTPDKLTDSVGFDEAAEPFIKKMEKLRDKIIKEMDIRKMDEVQFNDMTTAVDKLTKNIQLLSGKPTERIGMLSSLFDKAEEEE